MAGHQGLGRRIPEREVWILVGKGRRSQFGEIRPVALRKTHRPTDHRDRQASHGAGEINDPVVERFQQITDESDQGLLVLICPLVGERLWIGLRITR